MHVEKERSNRRMIFQARVLGGLGILLVLGYALLFRGGRLLILDALIAIVTSLILVGFFSLYLPGQITKQKMAWLLISLWTLLLLRMARFGL